MTASKLWPITYWMSLVSCKKIGIFEGPGLIPTANHLEDHPRTRSVGTGNHGDRFRPPTSATFPFQMAFP